MEILRIFDLKNYDERWPRLIREAVRSIIFLDNKIALVKSTKEGYYKFPGGGIEAGESHKAALIRETLEETGLSVIPDSIREFGMIKEIRKDKYDNMIFEQNSYYYFAEVKNELHDLQLDEYERELGFMLDIVDIETALSINNILAQNSKTEFISREAYALNLLVSNKE